MGKIERFEEIRAWQKSRSLVSLVYGITSDAAFGKDFALRDQLRRAAISIMLNIAEGFGHYTDKEFRRFLGHAHGSAAEVQSALYVALDLNYVLKSQFDEVYSRAEEVSKMLTGLSKYLDGKGRVDSGPSTPDAKT